MSALKDQSMNGPLDVRLSSNGAAVESGELVSLRISHGLNDIPMARVVIKDFEKSSGAFPQSDGPHFEPGAILTVFCGYGTADHRLFEGVIVGHRLRVNANDGAQLELECRDKAFAMTMVRKNAGYDNQSDSDIMRTLIKSYEGLVAAVQNTDSDVPGQLQFDMTDWDFLLSRASENGQVVIVDNGRVSCAPPELSAKPQVQYSLGVDMLEFDARVEQSDQTRSAYASMNPISGTVVAAGTAGIAPGGVIGLEGVGQRFNGAAYVSGVDHTIESGEWQTTVRLGLPAVCPVPCGGEVMSGLAAAASGLHMGKVQAVADDPQQCFRVKVAIPVLGDNVDGVWAGLSSAYATENAGMIFRPEIGDDVILGFADADTTRPVVLGSVHSKARVPALLPSDANRHKAIVTRSGLSFRFDDDAKTLTLETPAGNRLCLDDDGKKVTIEDQHSNAVTLSVAGISLKSAGDVTIASDGQVTIDAKAGVSLSSTGDVDITAVNVTTTAGVANTVKGGASAELSASGQTTVKGAMVMIN